MAGLQPNYGANLYIKVEIFFRKRVNTKKTVIFLSKTSIILPIWYFLKEFIRNFTRKQKYISDGS